MFVCLIGVCRPCGELFTHSETSTLPVRGYKLLPILGTHGIRAVRVLLWHGQPFIRVISEDFVRVSTKTVHIYKWSMCIFTELVSDKDYTTLCFTWTCPHVLLLSMILLQKYKIFKYESILYFVRLTKGFY